MKGSPGCPRCGGPVRRPGLYSHEWRCPTHGPVLPVQPVVAPSQEALAVMARESHVPVWLPWPLRSGWVVTGVTYAGDERTGPRASAVACSGPALRGGPADLVLVAEEPGVGLGAGYAGLPERDPGADIASRAPAAKVWAAGHPTPLWDVEAPPDRSVHVGEALGVWLWLVGWPDEVGLEVRDGLELVDLRDAGPGLDVPTGALSPRALPGSGP